MHDALAYAYIFVIFSMAGWLLELIYRSMHARKFINPGFLKGPFIPLYGSVALILSECIGFINHHAALIAAPLFNILPGIVAVSPDHKIFMALALISKGGIYAMITTGSELLTALFFRQFLKKSLWNYTGKPMCLGSWVCMEFSCYWIVLAFAFEYVFQPLALYAYSLVDPLLVTASNLTVLMVMAVDFVIRIFHSITSADLQGRYTGVPNRQEFHRIIRQLTALPEIQDLAGHRHHGDKNRLNHSLEVAWHGYRICRKLSLDYTAAARGGLLHDLFFYNWLTEGPRLHGFRHPRIALQNAVEITELSSRERDIIKKHMWPLTLVPPRYPEAWVVCMADTYCSFKDYILTLDMPGSVFPAAAWSAGSHSIIRSGAVLSNGHMRPTAGFTSKVPASTEQMVHLQSTPAQAL